MYSHVVVTVNTLFCGNLLASWVKSVEQCSVTEVIQQVGDMNREQSLQWEQHRWRTPRHIYRSNGCSDGARATALNKDSESAFICPCHDR